MDQIVAHSDLLVNALVTRLRLIPDPEQRLGVKLPKINPAVSLIELN